VVGAATATLGSSNAMTKQRRNSMVSQWAPVRLEALGCEFNDKFHMSFLSQINLWT
jgi:hypothetical protein